MFTVSFLDRFSPTEQHQFFSTGYWFPAKLSI